MSESLSEVEFLDLINTQKSLSILTSDSELLKFDKHKNILLEILELMPFDNFIERIISRVKSAKYDLVFISHVFFNSGMACENIDRLFEVCQKEEVKLAIDCRLSYFLPINFNAHYLIQPNIAFPKAHHSEIIKRQTIFREQLFELDHFFLCEKNILSVNYNYHGPFITFALPSSGHATKQYEELKLYGVDCDVIENRLRFDFLKNEKIDLSFLKLK